MRILIVTTSLPYPLASGGAIRVFGILKGLHATGHKLTLLSFGDANPQDTPLANICEQIEILPTPTRSKTERIKTLVSTSQADIQTRFYSSEFEQKLLSLLENNPYDLVQFEAIESACYMPIVREKFPDIKICFDTFNAEADLQRVIFEIDKQDIKRFPQAIYSWIQSRRIEQYEGDLCRIANLVIAVSAEDKAILAQYRHNDGKTYVVPSGIFVDDYATSAETLDLGDRTVVFTGKMDYRPNVDAMLWFADHILPKVPQANLIIVGQKPHPRIQHLPERDNISLTGWVDTIPPYLHATDVYIAPLRMGSGTRLKILEAMASGCAIIATTVAASGLSEQAKSGMMIIDDEAKFAQAINDLLDNPNKRNDLGNIARKMVKSQYDWSVLIPQLLKAYQEVGIG